MPCGLIGALRLPPRPLSSLRRPRRRRACFPPKCRRSRPCKTCRDRLDVRGVQVDDSSSVRGFGQMAIICGVCTISMVPNEPRGMPLACNRKSVLWCAAAICRCVDSVDLGRILWLVRSWFGFCVIQYTHLPGGCSSPPRSHPLDCSSRQRKSNQTEPSPPRADTWPEFSGDCPEAR